MLYLSVLLNLQNYLILYIYYMQNQMYMCPSSLYNTHGPTYYRQPSSAAGVSVTQISVP